MGSWEAGTPFIPVDTRALWIKEFYQYVETPPMEVMVLRKWKKKKRIMTAADSQFEEDWFGPQIPFPTERRPQARALENTEPRSAQQEWLQQSGIRIGGHLTDVEQAQVTNLLWVWRDLFVEKMENIPATDLVTHTIPTYPGARPHRAREPIYARDELHWQTTMIPQMIGTIINPGVSPWVAKTTWVSKKDTVVHPVTGRWPLRMVHTYCPLNDVTMKSNYPMKRIEPILDELADPRHRYYFSADAAFGFYAVPIYPPHAYKTAFNTILGQFYYLRMPMGLTGAPATYARLKDIMFGPIPAPSPEPAVISETLTPERDLAFKYFCDDDYGASLSFQRLLDFLHNIYFPRIHWARLTLKPSKSQFFVPTIEPLGMLVGRHRTAQGVKYGLRASDTKRGKLESFPSPQSAKDVENFLYLTTYLKVLIPGRTELARIMKTAVIRDKKAIVGFKWGVPQEEAFTAIKAAISENVVVRGDPGRRFYLSVCASKEGWGAVLFQLKELDEERLETVGKGFPKGKEQVVQFISQKFADTETRYLELERECLAVLRALEEVRFLIIHVKNPVVIYTNAAIATIMKGDEVKGRVAVWQMRMSEFNLDVRHANPRDMMIANGLARMPYMSAPRSKGKEWEDVYVLQEAGREEVQPARVFADVRPMDLTYRHDGILIAKGSLVIIYADGACRGNGAPGARAGVGVYVGPNHPYNQSRRITGDIQTNQVAELLALITAVKVGMLLVRDHLWTGLVVASDSEYACDGISKWIWKWRENEYKGVRNAPLFKELDEIVVTLETEGFQVFFWKIPRSDNTCADRLARKAVEEMTVGEGPGCASKGQEEIEKRWESWLVNPWYGDIVSFLLFGTVRGTGGSQVGGKRLRKVRKESSKYILRDEEFEDGTPKLVYREVNGTLAWCVRESDVRRILHRFHDSHGHFSFGVMGRNLLGRYYWPNRLQDIQRWCVACDACQRMGPKRSAQPVKPLLSLQPMDLLGMDFLGPITPNSIQGSVYILIVVDYFSRYLFAHATKKNTGHAVVEFLSRIAKTFGWPLAVYVDNGSHFVKGELPGLLRQVKTLLFSAPITHPQSVGLAERYVQMILAGLRVRVAADQKQREDAMLHWDEQLDAVVQAINTRILKVHGYTPSQLFLGFNVRIHPLDETVAEQMRKQHCAEMFQGRRGDHLNYTEGGDPNHTEGGDPNQIEWGDRDDMARVEQDLRIAQIEEIRELTRERLLQDQEKVEDAKIARYQKPQVGDLMLRRRVQVDKSLGMKLHSKWDGPYRLCRVSTSGVSGDLEDLKTGKVIGRYAFNSLKVFVPQETGGDDMIPHEAGGVGWVSLRQGLGPVIPLRGNVITLSDLAVSSEEHAMAVSNRGGKG